MGDFAVRQAAIALGKSSADIAKYANRSMNFVNHWDPTVSSDGYTGFSQRRYAVSYDAFQKFEKTLIAIFSVSGTELSHLAHRMLALLLIRLRTLALEGPTTMLGSTNVTLIFLFSSGR